MSATFLTAAEIHSRVNWPTILQQAGVPEKYLRLKKNGPCPFCGGTDRWMFDNLEGKGKFLCRRCAPKGGDGFELLMKFRSLDFPSVRKLVLELSGLARAQDDPSPTALPIGRPASNAEAQTVPRRVRDILRDSTTPDLVQDVVSYLASRDLWPMPQKCSLRAHATLEYFHERERIGRFPALVAPLVDINGELVTVHVTYLQAGAKLEKYEPRKQLSGCIGREGCAVRLVPLTGDALGIAEGLETALSAQRLHQVPVWSALNTSLLQKFEPPGSVRKLLVFADGDVPGIHAAARLMERLQGRVHVELHVPPAPAKDWNDVLRERQA